MSTSMLVLLLTAGVGLLILLIAAVSANASVGHMAQARSAEAPSQTLSEPGHPGAVFGSAVVFGLWIFLNFVIFLVLQDFWNWWTADIRFYIGCQLAAVAVMLLFLFAGRLKGIPAVRTIGFLLVTVLFVGFIVHALGGEDEKAKSSSEGVRQQKNVALAWSPCAKAEDIAVQYAWKKVPIKGTCSWKIEGSGQRGDFLTNSQACVRIRATGEDGSVQEKRTGICSGGVDRTAHFNPCIPLSRVEAMSEEEYPVYLTVRYFFSNSKNRRESCR